MNFIIITVNPALKIHVKVKRLYIYGIYHGAYYIKLFLLSRHPQQKMESFKMDLEHIQKQQLGVEVAKKKTDVKAKL